MRLLKSIIFVALLVVRGIPCVLGSPPSSSSSTSSSTSNSESKSEANSRTDSQASPISGMRIDDFYVDVAKAKKSVSNKLYTQKQQKLNPNYHRDQFRKFRQSHQDDQEYKASSRAYAKGYREKNVEKIAERNKIYRKEHKKDENYLEKHRARNRIYRQRNLKDVKQRQQEYRENNREKLREKMRIYRMKKKMQARQMTKEQPLTGKRKSVDLVDEPVVKRPKMYTVIKRKPETAPNNDNDPNQSKGRNVIRLKLLPETARKHFSRSESDESKQ